MATPRHEAYPTIPQTNGTAIADLGWLDHDEQALPICRHDYRCLNCGSQGVEYPPSLTNRPQWHANPLQPLVNPIQEMRNEPPPNMPTRPSERPRFPFENIHRASPQNTP